MKFIRKHLADPSGRLVWVGWYFPNSLGYSALSHLSSSKRIIWTFTQTLLIHPSISLIVFLIFWPLESFKRFLRTFHKAKPLDQTLFVLPYKSLLQFPSSLSNTTYRVRSYPTHRSATNISCPSGVTHTEIISSFPQILGNIRTFLILKRFLHFLYQRLTVCKSPECIVCVSLRLNIFYRRLPRTLFILKNERER